MIAFESGLERSVALLLMARNDIGDLREQWPKVEYRDANGRLRSHTFDFLVTTVAGSRIAIAVRPSTKVERSGLRETLGLISAQTGCLHADRFLIRTEEHVHRDDVVNARMIISARRLVDPTADAAVSALVDSLRGTVVLGDLVDASGLEGRAFAALVRCIADGTLSLVDGGTIRNRSRVSR